MKCVLGSGFQVQRPSLSMPTPGARAEDIAAYTLQAAAAHSSLRCECAACGEVCSGAQWVLHVRRCLKLGNLARAHSSYAVDSGVPNYDVYVSAEDAEVAARKVCACRAVLTHRPHSRVYALGCTHSCLIWSALCNCKVSNGHQKLGRLGLGWVGFWVQQLCCHVFQENKSDLLQQ